MCAEESGSVEAVERELHRRVQAGEQEALVQLFEALRPRLGRIVSVRLHPSLAGRIDPNDILQDAFLDLARKLPEYARREDAPTPFVWIRLVVNESLLITHRKHLNVRARDARREIRQQPSAEDSSSQVLVNCLAARVTSVSGRLVRQEMADALLAVIQAMQPMDRDVITMRVFEDLSNSEVAEVLGLSEKGASSRFVRAMTRLKRAVEDIAEVRDYLHHFLG